MRKCTLKAKRGAMPYRPITPQEINAKLHQRFTQTGFLKLSDLPNPSTFKDMKLATDRILDAIDKNQKIILLAGHNE